jgi:cytoskeletal protein RodZ
VQVDYVAFGQYLRQARQGRGLSIEGLSARTKIPPTLIESLEDGQAERFPERVFVVNYVRSYAAVVGLDPKEALDRFEQIPGAAPPLAFDPQALERERRERAISILWVFSAVVAVVLLGVGFDAMYDLALRLSHR